MKTRSPLYRTPSILIALLSSVTVSIAQTAPSQGPGVQSARDAREPQVLATCKHLAPPATFKAPPGFKPPSGDAHDYSTNTGGALSINKTGALFIVQRGLYPSIWQLRPERRLLANQYKGDPLDCLRTVINDLAADSRGGVYFTDGGVFYADAKGSITQYGDGLTTNGIVLSRDEKTLYVTNRDSVAAFDVQPDGSLMHQREFARLRGLGDGATIDADGRVYVTSLGDADGIEVFSDKGESLGFIPAPYPVISLAFGGPDKKTLYAVAETGKSPAQAAAILTLPMIAAGYPGRAK